MKENQKGAENLLANDLVNIKTSSKTPNLNS